MKTSPAARHTLDQLPCFSSFEPNGLVQRLETLLDSHRRRIAAITLSPQAASWTTVVEPMQAMADEVQRLFGPAAHLHGVADVDALREPYSAGVALLSGHASEIAQHPGLHACYQHIRTSAEYERYTQAQRKVVDNALRDFRLGGADLPPAEQAHVKALKIELTQLGTRFSNHVLDATQAFRLDVDDEQRLVGLPASVQELARQNAAASGRAGWTLTLDFPCYQPAISHLDDRELRRELYTAYVTRASEQGPLAGRHDNGEIMRSILAARHDLALTLGFANYAELSLATKMAPSTTAVVEFLRELAREARPAAVHELAELEEFSTGTLGLGGIEAWDFAWCAEKYRKQRFALSQEDLKPYFPVNRVLEGLFEVVRRLFGVRCERLADIDTWDPEVGFHAIVDENDEALGFFYLDLFARKRKRPGAWMDECLVRWRHDDELRLPVAYLTCNFTPAVAGQPSLLTHDEVRTLFHEFGHGLHHMLTRVDHPAVAGINGVPWDAVELPSQMLENWCWQRDALDLISAHHATGAPLPDTLHSRLAASQRFHAALQMLRQIELALFDFRLHLEYEPELDIQALLDAVREEVAVVHPPPWNRFQHTFAHIFAGGYAAGYYSYKWAEVLAADAYARFEESGVFDRDTGQDFRRTVLENGGAEDAMTLFEHFRGREPSVTALLRQAGLRA
ncbi:MAG: M3 family metallopeptidase [Gammaproteobacteria bacterium]